MTDRGNWRFSVPTDFASKRQLDRQVDRLEKVLKYRKDELRDLKDRVRHLEVLVTEIVSLRSIQTPPPPPTR